MNDDDNGQLNIGNNRPEQFDDDEHDAAHFATGTETPSPVRRFRRPPLSAFTIRRFELVGFDQPTANDHRIDAPVDLDQFYGDDDDEVSIIMFSTNGGNSDGHAELDDAIDALSGDADDDGYEPGEDGDDELRDADDDADHDDDDDDDDNEQEDEF